MEGHELRTGADFVVVALGQEGNGTSYPVHIADFNDKTRVGTIQVGAASYKIHSESKFGQIRMEGTCNGERFIAQIERGTPKNPLAIRVIHNGTQLDVMVLLPRVAELHALMPYKAPPDMSRYVLSPMPGLLVDVAVQVGQKVRAGERVAVIEAMKMENVLFATADGVVGKVLANKGESLSVDQPIVEFA
jgi:propionyl-CoA carboxylase alpha chain